RIENILKAARKMNRVVGILLDTKGPEIRTHKREGGAIELENGQEIDIMMTEVVGNTNRFSVTYDKLAEDVHAGSTILLDDGLIELEVRESDPEAGRIRTIIRNAGTLKDKKGVNVPGVSVQLPGITDKDASDILFGIRNGVDFIAASLDGWFLYVCNS